MRTIFQQIAYAAALAFASAVTALPAWAAADDAKAVSAASDASVPAKTDSADEAFKKLDRGAKGYVTWEDVAAMPDFATAFANADSTHLGRLNLVGFTQAWSAYVRGK
jgi:hypothetical protein